MTSWKKRRRNRYFVYTALGAAVVTVALLVVAGRDDTSDAEAAPDLTLAYFEGEAGTLDDLVGKPVVLNFWASWCPACVSEMPAFGEVHRRFGDRVSFIGINMQEVSLDAAADLVERTGVGYPLVHDPNGEIFRAFDGVAMPTTVFIRSDGTVARIHAGTIFEDALISLIEDELLG